MPVLKTIRGQRRDLGGFEVARLLPDLAQRAVGSFVFLDHMGPARFAPGNGIDVRAHPHIGLATITFLFEGALLHRDSLGVVQEIRPGDVNWMTAGRGIVHSERTPDALRASGGPLHGLQAWVALPVADEEVEPAFDHYPADCLPSIEGNGLSLRVLAGELLGKRSPVRTRGRIDYAAGTMAADARLALPVPAGEFAVYVVDGSIDVDGTEVAGGTLALLPAQQTVLLAARQPARLALLGGDPLDGPRHLSWNFVSSRRERIEQARADWQAQRFPCVPGESEFIPLP